MVSFPLHCKACIGVLIVDVIEEKGCIPFRVEKAKFSKYVTLKMTDVPSKHVWKIKESCYVFTTIYIVAAI